MFCYLIFINVYRIQMLMFGCLLFVSLLCHRYIDYFYPAFASIVKASPFVLVPHTGFKRCVVQRISCF